MQMMLGKDDVPGVGLAWSESISLLGQMGGYVPPVARGHDRAVLAGGEALLPGMDSWFLLGYRIACSRWMGVMA